MSHAEKVKKLVAQLASCLTDAGHIQYERDVNAAIDEMQAEIDRLNNLSNQHLQQALENGARANAFREEIDRLRKGRELRESAQAKTLGVGYGVNPRADEPQPEPQAMAELQKEAQKRAVMAHIQQNFPPLPEGAGDYFLDGDRWVRCNDSGPL